MNALERATSREKFGRKGGFYENGKQDYGVFYAKEQYRNYSRTMAKQPQFDAYIANTVTLLSGGEILELPTIIARLGRFVATKIAARGIIIEAEILAAKGGLTNAQLVQKSATLAERAIGGTGGVAGTAKHAYAKNLLSRYQSIYGDRGLSLGSNYFKGPAGKGFLDVVNHNTMTIYDFKFGNAVMSNAQYLKYSNSFPGYSIQIIRP